MTVRETTGIPVRLTAPRAHNAVGHVRRISVTRGWVVLCVAALATPALAAGKDQDTWKIRILPATKLTLAQAAAREPYRVPLSVVTPTTIPALSTASALPPFEPGLIGSLVGWVPCQTTGTL